MWHKILSYKKEVSIIAFLGACFTGLGYFIDTKIMEKNQPFQEKVIMEFKSLREQNIRLNDKFDSLKVDVQRTTSYMNDVLRVEIKDNAQNKTDRTEFNSLKAKVETINSKKVDKAEFHNQSHEINNRLNILEVTKDIHQDLHMHDDTKHAITH